MNLATKECRKKYGGGIITLSNRCTVLPHFLIIYRENRDTVFDLITTRCTSGFQNYWENLLVKYAFNKGILKERLAEHFVRELLMMLKQYLFLIVFIKAYVLDSFELPRLVEAIQISTHNICFYIKKGIYKYISCNLKITKLLDCALIVVCAVIRSNRVYEVNNMG